MLSRFGHGLFYISHTECLPTEGLEGEDLTVILRENILPTTMTVMAECTTIDPGRAPEVDDTVHLAEDIHLPMVN